MDFKYDDVGELVSNESDDFPSSQVDRNLYKAALIVRNVRQSIFEELGYTCSAGLSTYNFDSINDQ